MYYPKKSLFIVLLLLVVLVYGEAAKLPDSIKKCRKLDPNLSECFQKSLVDSLKLFAKGNRTLGLNPLEPFFVPQMDLGDTTTGSVSLYQQYSNVNIYGSTSLKNVRTKAVFTDTKCELQFTALAPQLIMEANYILKGKVLIFPINGNGTCKNVLYNVSVQHDIHCTTYKRRGNLHYKVNDYKIQMQPTAVNFNFDNTIPGNREINEEIMKTLNENGLEVFKDIKYAFELSFAYIYMNILNNFFARVPDKELFLD